MGENNSKKTHWVDLYFKQKLHGNKSKLSLLEDFIFMIRHNIGESYSSIGRSYGVTYRAIAFRVKRVTQFREENESICDDIKNDPR